MENVGILRQSGENSAKSWEIVGCCLSLWPLFGNSCISYIAQQVPPVGADAFWLRIVEESGSVAASAEVGFGISVQIIGKRLEIVGNKEGNSCK